ncbi:MAG: DNA repair protein RecO [bacterium]
MEVTYATKAIILRNEPWNDYDSRVVFYTKEKGKLNLIARGTKKISSKLAGHLEPLNIIDLMVINGKSLGYAGGAVSIDCCSDIKQDLAKLEASSLVVKWFDQNFKSAEPDAESFYLLEAFLNLLNKVRSEPIYYRLLASITILKLIVSLGHRPNLKTCSICQKDINNSSLRFDLINNGAVCLSCQPNKNQLTMDISQACLEKLEMIMNNQFDQVIKSLKINHVLANELNLAVHNFIKTFV